MVPVLAKFCLATCSTIAKPEFRTDYDSAMSEKLGSGNDGDMQHLLLPKPNRPEVPIVMILLVSGLLYLVTLWVAQRPSWKRDPSSISKTNASRPPNTTHHPAFPFIYIPTPASWRIPPSKALHYALEAYRREIAQAMQSLSRALEKALELEEELHPRFIPYPSRLSTTIEQKIQKISKCVEADEHILQEFLLKTFASVNAIADRPWSDHQEDQGPASKKSPSSQFRMIDPKSRLKRINVSMTDENAYDSAAQIIAHLVRDWTSLGANVRQSLYDWCVLQLQERRVRGPVLVPGAGMGRLAYELYQVGYSVEANELSPVMAAAASAILQKQGGGRVHPFVLDRTANEVEAERRYDSAEFPDTKIVASPQGGSLSFTIGDFAGDYYFSPAVRSSFGAVVTCFFIDTATNIYEYIELVERLLRPGGVWVNVGPVQWHGNALLFPTVDELENLIAVFNFKIVHWAVDETPVHYRQDESSLNGDGGDDAGNFVRTTNYDGYRPLRFVAVRK